MAVTMWSILAGQLKGPRIHSAASSPVAVFPLEKSGSSGLTASTVRLGYRHAVEPHLWLWPLTTTDDAYPGGVDGVGQHHRLCTDSCT